MEKFFPLLTKFCNNFEIEIFEFYNKFKSFIYEILRDRNIDLSNNILHENINSIEETVEKIIRIINLAFITVKYSKSKLDERTKQLKEEMIKKATKYPNYSTFLENELLFYINKNLLEIIIEYLLDIDYLKFKSLELYDILSIEFIKQIDYFKQQNEIFAKFDPTFKQNLPELINYINPFDFSIKPKFIQTNKSIKIIESKRFKKEPQEANFRKIEQPSQKLDNHYKQNKTQRKPLNILDLFSKFNPLSSNILERFDINLENLINIKDHRAEFFDLQNLFYYISILKMLNKDSVLNNDNIIEILKNFVNGKIFCSDNRTEPDPISIYYGLIILSEINLLNNNDIIDLHIIQSYLESEIVNIIPENLHLNFYIILCLKIIEYNGILVPRKTEVINSFLTLNILLNQEIINPILDIFEHLAIINILDKNRDLSQFNFYVNIIKRNMQKNLIHNQNVTDSSRMLLILDILKLKEKETKIYHQLFNFISSSTTYFDNRNNQNQFNWKIERIAFTIELRMLFWALIASSKYI